MASDDASVSSSTVHSYISLQDEYGISFSSDDDNDDDDGHAALQRYDHPNYNSSLSRLSVCSSTQELGDHQYDGEVGNSLDDTVMMMSSQFKSGLSLGTIDNISHYDDNEDADEEFSDLEEDEKHYLCHSLPATLPRAVKTTKVKQCSSSENKKRLRRSDHSHIRRWVMGNELNKTDDYHNVDVNEEGSNTSIGGAASSPIPTCHISNPGDDPRDVKARLKVWAQAVALASSSTCSSSASSPHGS